ncbi:STAS domain-containing protein [Macromonas bipunctata]|uniref:STAS domain-containing protein n=1 Tax=Macromonas bipunctata TaxID=183670 RepID=UPI000C33FAF0|nr:STAS domain-containing protein [Macromonas bipunctata]
MTDTTSVPPQATPAAPVASASPPVAAPAPAGAPVLTLAGELSIYQAQELKKTLLDAVQPGATLALDLSGVTALDTAGVQLLLLAQRTAQAQRGDLRVCRPSAPVLEVLQLLRLDAQLLQP